MKNYHGLGLVSKIKRQIKTAPTEIENLIPKSKDTKTLVVKTTNVEDIIIELQRIVLETLDQTKKLCDSGIFERQTNYETAEAVWDFINDYIAYSEETDEQLREPKRTWHDRYTGVDCDCYTIFISSILTNLNIPHYYRIAEYKNKGYFQHIYVIVPIYGDITNMDARNNYLVIDNVLNGYNKEENFTTKADFKAVLKVYQLGNMNQEIVTDEIAKRIRSHAIAGTEETKSGGEKKNEEETEENEIVTFLKKWWWVIGLVGLSTIWFLTRKKAKPTKTQSLEGTKQKRRTSKEIQEHLNREIEKNKLLKNEIKSLNGPTQKVGKKKNKWNT